tara:strand:- start:1764 stop:1979 length:216 start_codon:yes stop_codon:yes gene_type:complete
METPENITMISPEPGKLPAHHRKKQKKLGQAGSPARDDDGCPAKRLAKPQKSPAKRDGALVIRLWPAAYAG